MRWKTKRKPEHGDTRIVKKFLFFPKKLPTNGSTNYCEWRFLEKAKIRQMYTRESSVKTDDFEKWRDFCWED